jgi:shikimate dehydrogenase
MLAHPIEHVRAPEVLNPIFAARGIDAVMVPLHVLPDDFVAAWETFRRMRNLGGLVVSVPFKELALRLSDEADEAAAEMGAANTVRREADGRMVAANFDGAGFLAGVLDDGRAAAGRHALLIGAGGAGSAIAFSLVRAGVRSLRIADIDAKRAETLAARVKARHPAAAVTAGGNDPRGCDLIINATPCGLHPETDPLPLDPDRLAPQMLVVDIVMKPRTTPLLAAAAARGCPIRYGAGMLDGQSELMLAFMHLAPRGGDAA